MSFVDEMEAVRLDLRAVLKDMEGISPKTSLYNTLKAKADELNVKLSSMGAERKLTTK